MKKILCFILVFYFSLELLAQGKIYLEPYLGFFVGRSTEDKKINSRQNIIRRYSFGGKDLAVGGKLSYIKEKSKTSAGYEMSYYTSSYKRIETGLPRVNGYRSFGYGHFHSLYTEYARQSINFNVLLPNSFKKWLNIDDDKTYLISSKISPVLGLEYRFVYNSFINDDNSNPTATILTTNLGNYRADIHYLHLNANANITMRGGFNWEFFNGDKHKFTLLFIYKFAFRDVGYVRYRFRQVDNPSNMFDFQTRTRGNGLNIFASIPIKLYSFKGK